MNGDDGPAPPAAPPALQPPPAPPAEETSLSAFEYRAALALNNMAITMMERYSFRQAFETFKDASYAMMGSSTLIQQANDDDDDALRRQRARAEHFRTLQSKLAQAHRRTAYPRMSAIPVPVNVVSHDTRLSPEYFFVHRRGGQDAADAQEVTNDDDDARRGRRRQRPLVATLTSPMLSFTLIRIETNDIDILDSFRGSDAAWVGFPKAVILSNLAVAALCQAKNNASNETELRDFATNQLRMALRCLDRLVAGGNDQYFMTRAIIGMAISLKALYQTMESRGQMERAQMYANTLANLRGIASEIYDSAMIPHLTRYASAA